MFKDMCVCVCTWASVRLSPAVVMVAAFSQHAVGAVRERREEASGGRRLQARGAVGARDVGCWPGLCKRHHTGAASTGSSLNEVDFYCCDLIVIQVKLYCSNTDCVCVDLPRNWTTLVRVLLWAALVLGRRVPCPSDALKMSKPNTHIHLNKPVQVLSHLWSPSEILLDISRKKFFLKPGDW